MKIERLAIIGVGLIGGSIGLAVKKRGLAKFVIGVGRTKAAVQSALALGIIDEGFLEFAPAVRQAELAIFCTPVDVIAKQVLEAAGECASGTLLTDAGSTKARIVSAVEEGLKGPIHFVGGHPLAGSEKSGCEHADPDLFVERCTVLTPTPRTYMTSVERMTSFWEALGARVRLMSPEEHDRAVARTSHLPHVVASTLAAVLPEALRDLAASGFRDTTRIASGEPALWSAILVDNRQSVLGALAPFADRLGEFRRALEAGDRLVLERLLAQAKEVRDALGN
jgi:prephenate dehydrogenase